MAYSRRLHSNLHVSPTGCLQKRNHFKFQNFHRDKWQATVYVVVNCHKMRIDFQNKKPFISKPAAFPIGSIRKNFCNQFNFAYFCGSYENYVIAIDVIRILIDRLKSLCQYRQVWAGSRPLSRPSGTSPRCAGRW